MGEADGETWRVEIVNPWPSKAEARLRWLLKEVERMGSVFIVNGGSLHDWALLSWLALHGARVWTTAEVVDAMPGMVMYQYSASAKRNVKESGRVSFYRNRQTQRAALTRRLDFLAKFGLVVVGRTGTGVKHQNTFRVTAKGFQFVGLAVPGGLATTGGDGDGQ